MYNLQVFGLTISQNNFNLIPKSSWKLWYTKKLAKYGIKTKYLLTLTLIVKLEQITTVKEKRQNQSVYIVWSHLQNSFAWCVIP